MRCRFKSYSAHRGEIAIGKASCLLNSGGIHYLTVGISYGEAAPTTPSLSARSRGVIGCTSDYETEDWGFESLRVGAAAALRHRFALTRAQSP